MKVAQKKRLCGGGFSRQSKTSEKSDTTADIQMPSDMEMPEGFDPSQMQGRQPSEGFGGRKNSSETSENSDETKENSEEVSKSSGNTKDRTQRSTKISSNNYICQKIQKITNRTVTDRGNSPVSFSLLTFR